MAEKKTRRGTSQREAVEQIREGETFAVNLPVIGSVEIPRPPMRRGPPTAGFRKQEV